MTTVRRLFFGWVVLLVFMAGGFAAGAGERKKTDKLTGESALILGKASGKVPPDRIYCGQKVYPCYPAALDTEPNIPSPHTTLDAVEIVTAFMKDGKYTLIPVTVENGKPLNYAQKQWGKGRQLEVDAVDFPTLARTGLHSETELNRTKTITGRFIVEITELGRPGRSSGAGFISDDEDIISVIKSDNRLLEQLGLRHPQTARPLFHIWNMILKDVELRRLGRFWEPFEYILYNGQKVFVKAEGTRGWQESLFDDEIMGMFQIEAAFGGRLDEVLTQHFTRQAIDRN